jgi:hypothetical protein
MLLSLQLNANIIDHNQDPVSKYLIGIRAITNREIFAHSNNFYSYPV